MNVMKECTNHITEKQSSQHLDLMCAIEAKTNPQIQYMVILFLTFNIQHDLRLKVVIYTTKSVKRRDDSNPRMPFSLIKHSTPLILMHSKT